MSTDDIRARRPPAAGSRSRPLGEAFRLVGSGEFVSGGPLSVVPAPPHLAAAVVAFSGHTYVAADVDREAVMERMGENPFTGPVLPGFLDWLGNAVGGRPGIIDVVLMSIGTGRRSEFLRPELGWRDHDRANHGARLRREVSGWAYREDLGIVLVGRGLVDRWEVAYEVGEDAPPGTGRLLAQAARTLVPAGEPVFAQVAPGHARSIRATLAAGYTPIGSEVLFARAMDAGAAARHVEGPSIG